VKPPRLGEGVRAVPPLCIVCPGICLTTEENHGKTSVHGLAHERPNLYGKGPHRLLWAGSRATLLKITLSGIPNRLNYRVVFIMHN